MIQDKKKKKEKQKIEKCGVMMVGFILKDDALEKWEREEGFYR